MGKIEDVGIEALTELALNMRWSWNRSTDEPWSELEPEFWALTHNPWAVLQTVSPPPGYKTSWRDQTTGSGSKSDPHVLTVSSFMVNYLAGGPTVILSDGDAVFQPRKVERSGLRDAADGNVLIYIHKERELDDVEQRYPADHYVLVDDKLRILTAVKLVWDRRVTTIFPRQGHYAHDPRELAANPPADVTVERIGGLLAYDLSTLLAAASRASDPTTARAR